MSTVGGSTYGRNVGNAEVGLRGKRVARGKGNGLGCVDFKEREGEEGARL